MSPSQPDPFEHFAGECGLRMTVEPLYSAPRDILHPPAESDQQFLVTIRGARSDEPSVRLAFATPLTDREPPSRRDILWWLASDAWAIKEAEGDLSRWATGYGYSASDEATARLFDQHARQTASLEALLGKERLARLLAIYGSEIAASPRGARRST